MANLARDREHGKGDQVVMELHQVRYFLAACETRNFTRAAERCNVSQPALTAGIKKLEEELQGALFHRERGGVKLTTLGRMLEPRFVRMEAESASIQDIADDYQRLRQVPVRIGVLLTIGPGTVARYIDAFRRRAPAVELELRVDSAPNLIDQLHDADIDLAITNVGPTPPDWAIVRQLYEERYVVALPADHPLLSKASIELADLADEPYIDRLACELRDRVATTCASRGVELYAVYRTDREAWIECLVSAGVGVALLPERSFVSDQTARRPLVEPSVTRTVSLVRSADHEVVPAARLLWDSFLQGAGGQEARDRIAPKPAVR